MARAQSGIEGVNGALTVHLAPDQIVAALSLEFEDELRTPETEKAVHDLEHQAPDPAIVRTCDRADLTHRVQSKWAAGQTLW